MNHDWKQLMDLCGSKDFVIEKVRLVESGIRLEGNFELPVLAKLPYEDVIFIVAFIKAEGSIKEMEKLFGVSYPTIKSKLGRLKEKLAGIETEIQVSDNEDFNSAKPESLISHTQDSDKEHTQETKKEILQQLKRGLISSDEAIKRISKL